MSNVIKVGMADLNVVSAPDTIRTSGLGSCVGVVIYDEINAIAGMAHIMLPSSSLKATTNEAKYADTAIPALLTQLEKRGSRLYSLKAKLAGGAQMFSFSTGNDLMRIGPRNVEAIKGKLRELGIPIVSEDVGGKSGRTIEFNPITQQLQIRTVNKGASEI